MHRVVVGWVSRFSPYIILNPPAIERHFNSTTDAIERHFNSTTHLERHFNSTTHLERHFNRATLARATL